METRAASTQQGNHSEEDHFASETSAEIAWKSCKAIQPSQSSLCEGFVVLIAGVIISLKLALKMDRVLPSEFIGQPL